MIPQIVQGPFLTEYVMRDAIYLALHLVDRLHDVLHGLGQLGYGLFRTLIFRLAITSRL